jgi:low temperature requirement protein LtrA
VTLCQMLAAAAMAVQLGTVPGTGETGFVLAYIGIRACLVALYARVRSRYPDFLGMNNILIGSSGAAILVWALSLWLPPPGRYIGWALALLLELGAPAIGVRLFTPRNADTALLPERYGLFTLIVLGEAMFAVISNLGQQAWKPAGLAAALIGFGLAVSVWWSYFNYVERAPLQCSLGNGVLYSYLHLPLILGLTMASVGVGRSIREADGLALTPGTVVALIGGLSIFLVCFLMIQVTTYPRELAAKLWKTYGPVFAVLTGLSIAAAVLPPLVVLGAYELAVAVLHETGITPLAC